MGRTDKTAIKKVEGVDPSFLAQYAEDDKSLDGMGEYRVLSALRIIQNTSKKELKKAFGEGSVIIRPGDALVWAENDDPFLFVPQFFFVEFCKWSDLDDKESRNVLERTYNPTSDLAKRSRDPERRFEPYDGHEDRPDQDQWKYRYVEHLRFPGLIYGDHPLAGTPTTLSFERGEFGQGKNFISAIKLRKQRVEIDGEERNIPVPLWSQVWSLKVGHREIGSKQWFGFDFVPADIPLIGETEHQDMYKAYLELREDHEQKRLLVDDEDLTDDDAETAEQGQF
jgi:hypothetical protein